LSLSDRQYNVIMKKTYLILVGIVSMSTASYGQEDPWVIDKVSAEICTQLQQFESLQSIDKAILNKLYYGTINKYKTTWNKQLENFPNSQDQRARDSYYYQTINHRLLISCTQFQEVDGKIDKTLSGNPLMRSFYLQVKEFTISAENNPGSEGLQKYFSKAVEVEQLNADLQQLKAAIDQYKHLSNLNIVNSGNRFFISLYDYQTGIDYVNINLVFQDLTDLLVDNWNFKLKDELEKERMEFEKAELEGDFDDIMSLPSGIVADTVIKNKRK